MKKLAILLVATMTIVLSVLSCGGSKSKITLDSTTIDSVVTDSLGWKVDSVVVKVK